MTPARVRFLQVWAACALLCAAAVLGTALALRATLSPTQRDAAIQLLAATGTMPYLVAILGVAVTGFIAAGITRRYFLPLHTAAEATRVTALANTAHRVAADGPPELCRLVAAINTLAERHEAALQRLDARMADVRSALDDERNRLAVLIAELPEGVVVCNAEGVVLLYNEQARRLLCAPQGHAFLGLGRSLYSVLPHDAIRAAIGRLLAHDVTGPRDAVVQLALATDRGPARIRIAPVAGASGGGGNGDGQAAGFVVVLESEGEAARLADSNSSAAGRDDLPPRPVFYDFDLFQRRASDGVLEERPLAELAYTVFDTETTGLDPSAGDEIVAIGAVRIVNGRIVPGDSFDCLVDPARALDPRSIRIHGLTTAMLQGEPPLAAVLPRFHAFCADTVLVGHNVAFDLRFLELKEEATGVRFRQPVLDTLLLADIVLEHGGNESLDAIARCLGIEAVARHTALGDATTTAQVFLKMLPLLAARGIATLGEAQAASRRTRHARIRY